MQGAIFEKTTSEAASAGNITGGWAVTSCDEQPYGWKGLAVKGCLDAGTRKSDSASDWSESLSMAPPSDSRHHDQSLSQRKVGWPLNLGFRTLPFTPDGDHVSDSFHLSAPGVPDP